MRWTALPLTDEEADDWAIAAMDDEVDGDGDLLTNILAGQATIDTSALPQTEDTPRLGGLTE